MKVDEKKRELEKRLEELNHTLEKSEERRNLLKKIRSQTAQNQL